MATAPVLNPHPHENRYTFDENYSAISLMLLTWLIVALQKLKGIAGLNDRRPINGGDFVPGVNLLAVESWSADCSLLHNEGMVIIEYPNRRAVLRRT